MEASFITILRKNAIQNMVEKIMIISTCQLYANIKI